eukprot:4190238-Amphidinium_carterae.1
MFHDIRANHGASSGSHDDDVVIWHKGANEATCCLVRHEFLIDNWCDPRTAQPLNVGTHQSVPILTPMAENRQCSEVQCNAMRNDCMSTMIVPKRRVKLNDTILVHATCLCHVAAQCYCVPLCYIWPYNGYALHSNVWFKTQRANNLCAAIDSTSVSNLEQKPML